MNFEICFFNATDSVSVYLSRTKVLLINKESTNAFVSINQNPEFLNPRL